MVDVHLNVNTFHISLLEHSWWCSSPLLITFQYLSLFSGNFSSNVLLIKSTRSHKQVLALFTPGVESTRTTRHVSILLGLIIRVYWWGDKKWEKVPISIYSKLHLTVMFDASKCLTKIYFVFIFVLKLLNYFAPRFHFSSSVYPQIYRGLTT